MNIARHLYVYMDHRLLFSPSFFLVFEYKIDIQIEVTIGRCPALEAIPIGVGFRPS